MGERKKSTEHAQNVFGRGERGQKKCRVGSGQAVRSLVRTRTRFYTARATSTTAVSARLNWNRLILKHSYTTCVIFQRTIHTHTRARIKNFFVESVVQSASIIIENIIKKTGGMCFDNKMTNF